MSVELTKESQEVATVLKVELKVGAVKAATDTAGTVANKAAMMEAKDWEAMVCERYWLRSVR